MPLGIQKAGFTVAATMVQSSQPTFLTIRNRIHILMQTTISARKETKSVVAIMPGPLSSSPIGGGLEWLIINCEKLLFDDQESNDAD